MALTNNGGFTYQSTNSFTGVDVFNYKATDGQSTSAVATAAIIVLPPGGLFNDNFARPTNYNSIFPWTLQLATAVPALDPAPSGTWTITNNTFIGASTTYYTRTSAYYNNPNWTNYSVQAQLQVSSTNGVGAGLGGRLNPATGARYIAWMYPENSPDGSLNGLAAMAIFKYENWTNYTEGNFIRLPSVGTSQHTVTLTFQGSSVLAYFDGTLVTNWTDDGFFDGQPALTSGGIDVETYEALGSIHKHGEKCCRHGSANDQCAYRRGQQHEPVVWRDQPGVHGELQRFCERRHDQRVERRTGFDHGRDHEQSDGHLHNYELARNLERDELHL